MPKMEAQTNAKARMFPTFPDLLFMIREKYRGLWGSHRRPSTPAWGWSEEVKWCLVRNINSELCLEERAKVDMAPEQGGESFHVLGFQVVSNTLILVYHFHSKPQTVISMFT